jgi:hypothetical protein
MDAWAGPLGAVMDPAEDFTRSCGI